MVTALILAVLAVLLAWPVPLWLDRQKWMWANPFAAMVIWQTVAVAGMFSLLGAPLAAGLSPLGDTVPVALRQLLTDTHPPHTLLGLPSINLVLLVLSALLAGHLLLTLLVTVMRLQREVNQHKNMVKLLGEQDGNKGTYVLPADQPVAYCLPGLFQPVTVVSSGLQDQLTEEQYQAVLRHEQAHLRQSHHLLLAAFLTWRQALPWLPVTERAQAAVASLVEILADEAVLESHDRAVLLNAVVAAYPLHQENPVTSFVPSVEPEASPVQLSPRLANLVTAPTRSQPLAAAMIATSTLGLLGVLALLVAGPI